MAFWAFQKKRPAGRGTDTLPDATGLHLPLLVGDRVEGVLGVDLSPDHILSSLVGCPAGGEGGAASSGYGGEANRVGVDYGGVDVISLEAEDFGSLHGDRGARATNVGRAFDQVDTAIGGDV